MNSLPPTFNSAKFNTLAFNSGGFLTKSQADLLYLPYSTWNILNSTPGVVTANKAVIVDGNKDIATFRNMYATKYFGDNIDINNDGSLNLYGSTNSIHLHSTTAADILLNGSINNSITFGGSTGFILMQGNSQYITLDGTGNYIKIANTAASTNSTSGAIRCQGGIYTGNNNYFNASTTYAGTNAILSMTGSNGIITLSNTEASVASGSGCIRASGGAYFGNDSYFENMLTIKKRLYFKTTTVFNMTDADTCDLYGTHFHAQGAVSTGTQQSITSICFSALSGISNDHTPGIAITYNKLSNFQGDLLFKAKVAGGQTGSCVEVMRIKGASGDLNVLYNLDLTNFNGSTVGLKLAGTLVTASATELNYNDITTLGTSQASKVITTNASNNTLFGGTLDLTGFNGSTVGLKLAGTLITSSALELNYNDITTLGTSQASKVVTTDGSNNISLGGNITFTGTNTIASSTQDLNINMATTGKKLIISNNTGANGEICRFQGNSSTSSLSINMGTADVDIYTNSSSYGMSFSVNNTPSTPHIWLVNNATVGNKQQVSINSRDGQWAQLNVNCNSDTRNESGYYIAQRWYHTLTGIKSTALAICDLQVQVASPYTIYMGTSTNTPFVIQQNNTSRMYFFGSGNCSIGGNVDTCPLYINSTTNITLSPLGTPLKSVLSIVSTLYSNNTTYTNQPVSFWTKGSIVSENLIFQYSDRRLKENINPLSLEKCLLFMNINAMSFNYKKNKKPSIGFIAQDIIKYGFLHELINLLPAKIEEENDSPADYIYAVSMDSIIPIHHTIIKNLISENEKLKRRLDFLEEKINSLI